MNFQQGYYDENPEIAVICHNDAHGGNIMRNKDGEVDYDSIILVDFDQAGYGFRMWDIQYFLRSVFEHLFNNQRTFSVI